MDRLAVQELIAAAPDVMQRMGLLTRSGNLDRRKNKKLTEVAGFIEHILKILPALPDERRIVFLECSCGKSYLSLALDHVLRERFGRVEQFIGVDFNPKLVQRCREAAAELGRDNLEFHCSRTIEFEPPRPVDVTLALHACDTATDEAIAKGVQVGAAFILVVPCCQNQIRGQVKSGHPLAAITEFGPLRYHLANLLTEALRATILRGAGYDVTMDEIVPPTVTPKNLLIRARKIKSTPKRGIEDYQTLQQLFHVKPKLAQLLPEVVAAPPKKPLGV